MNRFAAGHDSGTRSAVPLFAAFLVNRTLAPFRNGPAVAGDRIATAAVLGTTGVIVLADRLGSRYVRRRRDGTATGSGRRHEVDEARPLAGAG
ncbi:hypothetical protein [Actinacidiphila glaucinigra]|uniref:hypothetical protein n=1 Tax=Actinacidiphila glaucinigra TaxID=235986 RepID=UPI0036F0A4A3